MDLKQIKRIKNLLRFNTGTNVGPIKPTILYDYNNLMSNSTLNKLDSIVGTPKWQDSVGYQRDLNLITKNAQQQTPQQPTKKPLFNVPKDPMTYVQSSLMLLNGINQTLSLGRKSANEMVADGGMSLNTIMGVGYNQFNGPDESEEISNLRKLTNANTLNTTLTGASIGANFGPIGAGIGGAVGLIGGLFGGHAARRRMRRRLEEAKQRAYRSNVFNQASAMSEGLLQDYNLYHDNTQDDILYANRGKDLKPRRRKCIRKC